MALIVFACLLLSAASCSGNESKVKNVLQDYLKGQGVKELALDLFYPDPKTPDKAYASATITYNFAGADGALKREFLGFFMTREGNGWRVDRITSYTKEETKAATLLAGGK